MFNPLHLNCPHCGGTLQAKDSADHGKEVRCPRCQHVFQLELQDLSGTAGESNAATSSASTGNRPTVQFRPKRRSPWLLTALAIVLIGVSGAVVALFYKPSPVSAGTPLDVTYLLPDTDVVACLKVGEVLGSPLLRDLTSNAAAEALLTLLYTQSGISPRQIESVTVGLVVKQSGVVTLPGLAIPAMPRQPFGIAVVRSNLSFDPEQIAVKSLKGIRLSHAGKTYFKFPMPPGQGFDSCYFPESNVAVVALEQDLKAVIDNAKSPVKTSSFDFVRADQTFVVAATSDAFDLNPLHPPVTTGVNLQALESTLKQNFRSGSFGLTIKNQLELELHLNCQTKPGATKVKGAIDLNVTDLKALLKKQQNWLNLSGLSDVDKLATDSLDSISVTQTDEKLQATAAVPEELKAIISKYTAAVSPFMPAIAPAGIPGAFPGGIPGISPVPGGPSGLPNGLIRGVFDPTQLWAPKPTPTRKK